MCAAEPTGLPLDGIRVLEIGNYMAAPYCAMQLADLGADVIKIEPPNGGDAVRGTAPFQNGESGAFVRLNRHKRSLAMDLKAEAGKAVARRLAQTADILVENLRPGAMARLGLDYRALQQLNPRLIYLALSGWGQEGPLAQRPGMDIMVQARSGLMSITGEPDGDPVKVGVPICDLVCALYATVAALVALAVRDRTGDGRLIDISLFESTMSLAIWEAGRYFTTGEVPARLGSAHQTSAPYQAIRAEDGWLAVGATTSRTWAGFCRALGVDHLIDDPDYADVNRRFANRGRLIGDVEQVTRSRPVEHWIGRLEAEEVPCAPLQDFGQSFNDPQLVERDFFWDAPHPVLGSARQLGSPMRISGLPLRRGRAAPLLGEDTRAILSELGYTSAEVNRLLQAGVIAAPG